MGDTDVVDTPFQGVKTLDELRAEAAAAQAALEAAEYAAAHPPLTLEQATAKLEAAEAELKRIEGPYWDHEHAVIDYNVAVNKAIGASADDKPRLDSEVAEALLKMEAAKAAFEASEWSPLANDLAAQAVIDAREAVAKAQEA